MASKITISPATKKSGVDDRSMINQDNATPVSPLAPESNSFGESIISAPRGPDGRNLVLSPTKNTWNPAATKSAYSDDTINNLTNNGIDTEDVMRRGLDELISETKQKLPSNLLTPPQRLKPSTGVASSNAVLEGVANGSTEMIGQQLWQYKVVLFNHQQRYEVPAHAINVLCIEDDILSWPLRGYIVIDNRMEAFERGEDFNMFYYLRSDARDEIYIDMKPIVDKGDLPDKIWRIEMDAIIYDVEDLPHSDMTHKAKKLYFWDKRFQHLLEKNIQWSTATGKRYSEYTNNPICPKPIAHATDTQRSMYTGEAIASLLYEAGYESFIDFDNWNWGKSRIQFTAKANWSIWECISYILDQQVSDDGKLDICILQWERGIRKWQLRPVWKFFEKAGKTTPGELQVEHMFFEEPVSQDTGAITPSKAPMSFETSNSRDIKVDEYNKIRNYRFSQTSGLDNSKAFVSHPVYSHWHKKKQFDIDVKENEIKTVKEKYFKKNYVENILSPGKYPVMTMNKAKTDQRSINPQFSPISTLDPKSDRYARRSNGCGKILYAGLFLNQNLVVRMTGSSHRLAGTFIGVDRIRTNSDTIYDYQICGQYFVTNVKHIIQQKKYVNDITMVKIHAYEALPVNEGVE